MPFHTEVEQGSADWLKLRAGIPTASNFKRILSPTGRISTQAAGYMQTLLAEWIVGHPYEEKTQSEWMEHGELHEQAAVDAFEFQTGLKVEKCGFITNDSGLVGASPDRMVGDDYFLEIKCPKHNTHVGYMISEAPDDDHKPQAQGQIWVGNRKGSYVVSYHPEMPTVIVKVERDEKYIELLDKSVSSFVEVMLRKREELNKRYGPFIRLKRETANADPFNISEDDIDLIWADVQAKQVHA